MLSRWVAHNLARGRRRASGRRDGGGGGDGGLWCGARAARPVPDGSKGEDGVVQGDAGRCGGRCGGRCVEMRGDAVRWRACCATVSRSMPTSAASATRYALVRSSVVRPPPHHLTQRLGAALGHPGAQPSRSGRRPTSGAPVPPGAGRPRLRRRIRRGTPHAACDLIELPWSESKHYRHVPHNLPRLAAYLDRLGSHRS